MPVTTRAQSRRAYNLPSTTSKNANSYLPSKLSTKIGGGPSYTTTSSSPTQNPIASKKPHRAKRPLPPPQKPRKRPRKHQRPDKREQPQTATELPPPDLTDSTTTQWVCQTCPCPRGAFDYPADPCTRCGHKIEQHEKVNPDWDPRCNHICERKDLIAKILELLEVMKKVFIHATPQSGKSILLYLLGHHVLYRQRELEPVFIDWKPRRDRHDFSFREYLKQEHSLWQGINAKYRPCNPGAKPLFLIDEGQKSYEEQDFWARELKNPGTRDQPMFVMVFPYGTDADISRKAVVEAETVKLSAVLRVDLRPSSTNINNPYILFKLEETTVVVQKWATYNRYELTDDVYEYLHTATNGHPGMVGFVLQHFDNCVSKSTEAARRSRLWTPQRCHEILIDNNELINQLTLRERGLWTTTAEVNAKAYFEGLRDRDSRFRDFKFSDVVNTLRQVVTQPHGYTSEDIPLLFEFCHYMGYLYREQNLTESTKITYTFASPIHQRVAYRRLFPGPEPDSASKNLTLRQTCFNAIERMSPSILRTRSVQSPDCGVIPEAAYQDEIYCALNFELHDLLILSEYSRTKDGRIDFFIFQNKWGIEVLQGGSVSQIAEHAARFCSGGRYKKWNIFKEYIILNFCSKSTVRKIEIEDFEVQSRILQVAVDPKEYTAEVYTCDKQLLATLTLGKGRERLDADKYNSPSDDSSALEILRNRKMKLKQGERQAGQGEGGAKQAKEQASQAKKQAKKIRGGR